jgi:hypothetical protein
MIDLFEATRDHTNFKQIIVPPELSSYVSELYKAYTQPLDLILTNGVLIKADTPQSDYGIFTLTGGKDSLAVFLKNRQLYGITPYVGNSEREQAESIANKLNVNLETVDLNFNGTTTLVESVIKNQMIYALIMNKLDKNPLAIGFGGTSELGPQSMCFYHDNPHAFENFRQFAISSWGNHELMPFLKDEVESFEVIYANAPDLINMISSCMTPINEKISKREQIQQKFGVSLDNPYQCGVCYKCAEEQIIAKKYHGRKIPLDYENFCKTVIINKCLFEKHNLNRFEPTAYLAKLGITSVLSKKEDL